VEVDIPQLLQKIGEGEKKKTMATTTKIEVSIAVVRDETKKPKAAVTMMMADEEGGGKGVTMKM